MTYPSHGQPWQGPPRPELQQPVYPPPAPPPGLPMQPVMPQRLPLTDRPTERIPRLAGAPGRAWPPPPRRPRRGKLWLALAGALLALATIVAGVGFAAGWFGQRRFDTAAMQTGVAMILTDRYHLTGVGAVSCPDSPRISAGAVYTCTVQLHGATRTVTIQVLNEDGTYSVSPPR